MNVKKCTVCNIEIDENNCKKDRNKFKKRYNRNRKKYNINEKKRKYDDTLKKIEKPEIDKVNISTYENHAFNNVGPRKVRNTFYMHKVLEKIGKKRPIHIMNRYPNQ